MLFLIAALLFAFGLVQLFCKDAMWASRDSSNRRRGVKSERTPEWELSTTAFGCLSIVMAVVLLFTAFADANAKNNPMSGTSVDGRQLTQEEARQLDKDPNAFFNSHPRR